MLKGIQRNSRISKEFKFQNFSRFSPLIDLSFQTFSNPIPFEILNTQHCDGRSVPLFWFCSLTLCLENLSPLNPNPSFPSPFI